MKTLLSILFFIISIPVFAKEPRHSISIGSGGLGLSGAYEKMTTKENSLFDNVDYNLRNLAFNYAYRVSSRFQVGGFYQSSYSEYDFKNSEKTNFIRQSFTAYGLFSLYNFSDQMNKAFYLGLGISTFTLEEEIAHGISEAESKAPFELDDTGFTYELIFGKRFIVWDHFSYSPNISVYYRSHGRDFNDQDVDDGIGLSIQAIKFDLLF